MTGDKVEATYHNPPKPLDVESLARLLYPSHWCGKTTCHQCTQGLKKAAAILASPEVAAHNSAMKAEGWEEGWRLRSDYVSRGPSVIPPNPYGATS